MSISRPLARPLAAPRAARPRPRCTLALALAITAKPGAATEVSAKQAALWQPSFNIKVEATINDVTWRTSVFPMKSGGYFLPVKADVRRKAGIAAGDELTVSLELL